MNAILDPAGGTVTLRGIVVELSSPVAQIFLTDVCRHIEGGMDADQLRAKYGLSDDKAYADLASNEPLQLAIGREREKRIRDGTAQREKAAQHWLTAVDVVGAIAGDPATPVRSRIEAARELRTCVQGTQDNKPDARERFVINISFGSHKLERNVELTPIKHDDGDELEAPRPTGLADYVRG
jgi:hypothetical protein